MNRNLLLTIILALCAFILPLSSCSDDDDNHYTVPGDAIWSIVTVEATGTSGTVFTFNKDNDSELITLTSNTNISSMGLPEKARVIIAYKPVDGNPYTSGAITLYGVGLLNGTVTKIGVASQYAGWSSDPIDMLALARSGMYINVTATAYYYKAPSFLMVFDENTIDDEVPTAYLLFNTDNLVNQNFSTLYGSFSIADVWNRDTCKGIKVVYQTSAGRSDKIFHKSTGPLTPSQPQD